MSVRIEPDTRVKVFSATLARDREALGEKVTRWLGDKPKKEILDYQIQQSSDAEFHCLTFVFFYRLV